MSEVLSKTIVGQGTRYREVVLVTKEGKKKFSRTSHEELVEGVWVPRRARVRFTESMCRCRQAEFRKR